MDIFGHKVFLVWWFGGRFRKYTLTMEDSWWSGWRISIGSVSTPNGRAGWLMYQGSRRWGGWADSFVSSWAQYSVHTLCVHMAYLHIDCVHIAHYFVHIPYLQIACVHNAYLDIACVQTRCYTAGMNTWAQACHRQCAVFVSVQNTVCTHFGASRLKQASFAEAPTSGATVYIG